MRIAMPTHSDREDIHCIKDNVMTLLTDHDVNIGDEIVSPYKNTETHYAVFHVEEIVEKRRPMGEWQTEPPHLYKIGFRKEMLLWLRENNPQNL